MQSKIHSIKDFTASHIARLLRLAGLISIVGGLIGGFVWLAALVDRSDGDDLRWGFFHNPFMQFYPFNEAFLDLSMWVLLACSAAVGVGGLFLMIPRNWGIPLVTSQARVSIIINSAIVFCIPFLPLGVANTQLEKRSLALRLGSIAVDLILWKFLSGKAVKEYFAWQSHLTQRAFEVITAENQASQ